MRELLSGVYFRNFIVIVLLFSVSIFILGMAFAAMSYSFILRQRASGMTEAAGTAGVMLRSYAQQWREGLGSVNIGATLSWMSRLSGYHMMVTDSQGMILNCSDNVASCYQIGLSVPSGAVSAINRNGSYRGFDTFGDVYPGGRFIVGLPLPAGPNTGYIFVSDDGGRLSGIWTGFARIFLFAAAVVIVLGFVISYIVIRKTNRPIKEMSDAARSYSRGDFSPRVRSDGRHDEMAELTEAFNVMADSLERMERSHRELIANVSHELKTPMTTISGFADAILDGTVPPEQESEYLQIISSETKRLSRLVRGMLDMSQLQSITPMELQNRSFDLLEVVC